MKFEIYTRKDNRIGIRLKGNNGEIVLAGEGYHSEGNARRAIKRIKEAVKCAEVFVVTDGKKRPIATGEPSAPVVNEGDTVPMLQLKALHDDASAEDRQWAFGYNAAVEDFRKAQEKL